MNTNDTAPRGTVRDQIAWMNEYADSRGGWSAILARTSEMACSVTPAEQRDAVRRRPGQRRRHHDIGRSTA